MIGTAVRETLKQKPARLGLIGGRRTVLSGVLVGFIIGLLLGTYRRRKEVPAPALMAAAVA